MIAAKPEPGQGAPAAKYPSPEIRHTNIRVAELRGGKYAIVFKRKTITSYRTPAGEAISPLSEKIFSRQDLYLQGQADFVYNARLGCQIWHTAKGEFARAGKDQFVMLNGSL